MNSSSGSIPSDATISPDGLLSAIIDSSDDAIISKNLKGVVTSWNQGAERIFGYTAEEMVGQSILRLIPAERQNEERQILDKLCNGERVDHFETQRIRKDGNIVEVSLCISPVRDDGGFIVGASKIARDISMQKKATQLAATAMQESELQGRMKDEFLATLSHELRTPLQAILGWTQILLSGHCEPEEVRQGIEVIDRNAHAQCRIIDDLLDMNRILSGKVRLEVQRVELIPLLEDAIENARPAANAKNLRLQSVFDPAAQPVFGDPNRLQQIFWNLLNNAIKFTASGGRIQVLLTRVHSHLEVSVNDTGIGIDPDFLPHVFERFRQADASSTRTQGGLGLGLAIVKHLAELHGGTVKASSAGRNQGSTFTLMLPMVVIQPETEAGSRHPASSERSSSAGNAPHLDEIRVMIVDDEEDSRNLLQKMLAKAGAVVTTARSVQQALDLWGQAAPDVLISDIGMPDRDGYSLIREIRQLPASQGGNVPAIALTAYTRTEDRIKAIAAGFQMHISKPADSVELMTVVSSLAGKPQLA
ncbi:ATP-binding protein [Prosthecobacter sp.]|uniref:hybrid sensor histidine kinase/response regulator n=1 Tax=Prosthecobacter sp. TaxID=1965333 RepID=UPI00378336E9